MPSPPPCLTCTKQNSSCSTRNRVLGMCLNAHVPRGSSYGISPSHRSRELPHLPKQDWSRPRLCLPAAPQPWSLWVLAGGSLVPTLSTSPAAGPRTRPSPTAVQYWVAHRQVPLAPAGSAPSLPLLRALHRSPCLSEPILGPATL